MKTRNSLYILFLTVLLTSCDFSLDQNPITEKDGDKFYKTEVEIEEAVTGAYSMLRGNGLYGTNMPVLGEIPSDNTFDEVPANDGGNYGELDEFTTIPTNSVISSNWRESYRTIQRCNTVLNRITDIVFKNEEVKINRMGEMKFIRGLMYFNMVRLFGDVPLVITETTDVNDHFGQGRTDLNLVYEQIIIDLEEAIEELPVKGDMDGRVEKGAAQTLLAKVYLTLDDKVNAKKYIDEVINSNQYQLLEKGEEVFTIANKGNAEVIFAAKFASGINGNAMGSQYYRMCSPSGHFAGGKGHNIPTQQLYNLYDDNDARKDQFVLPVETIYYVSGKMEAPVTDQNDCGSDYVILRYADVVLMSAEIENALGNTSLALERLNSIRRRSNVSEVTSTTDLEGVIAEERRLELVGEGHRWFDLLRTGKAIEVMNAHFEERGQNITVPEFRLLMPIPQSQIDTDPAIKQNPGY
ncbi:RagB/SusD family nutrient uptake outer membrane protein [Flammeovirga sp. EKP202]|uniref:RagB/SusD family nutrient uptake outer membrane protein n=1 Tax=Flammeovirga sp. EKP202 TaxID=2770592 RepID=UPI00165FC897|nr:RagB/SusD family nutrient uptake outer membrane protein [Flammeovirga sp. EKP202]MBD0400665.1 RagB/SusD family nutrient uptake outer membrane protein [Flammeovirga sp. EKP202]